MSDPKTAAGFRQHVQEKRYFIMRQPVVDLETMQPIHDEWLVRFEADEGLVDMLRPAEISGAIATLDVSMLEQAIRTLNLDRRRLPIAVNLSGASMLEPPFEEALFYALSKQKTAPERLIIELTETWDMRDLTRAQHILSRLSAAGHPLCLDDVGAGAASIRYLRAFETQWLKIDGDFVQAAMHRERDLVILKNLLNLRQDLNLKIIAEGVEDQAVITFVKSLGFDAAQGYALGTPSREPIRK
ncbi:EAL domain-containing protein [Robiginitomaculum antarcticum]|uniref:EAL domain-containing protein n=1 Tax=Robiginitomaculum antarcticum TaxID=437507 RepID=UPI00035F3D03|nr:EAL domain-containing protein [Robiginitomaculum antarcticum]